MQMTKYYPTDELVPGMVTAGEVRTKGGHGIVYVCDGNNCRIFINIGLRQTGWITTAVTSLVMAENCFFHVRV
jgi:hypothetical protein